MTIGWDDPESSDRVAFAHKHEFRLAVDLTVLFGEEDMTAIVTELLDGQE